MCLFEALGQYNVTILHDILSEFLARELVAPIESSARARRCFRFSDSLAKMADAANNQYQLVGYLIRSTGVTKCGNGSNATRCPDRSEQKMTALSVHARMDARVWMPGKGQKGRRAHIRGITMAISLTGAPDASGIAGAYKNDQDKSVSYSFQNGCRESKADR
jgi:hypothetical protein